jgi:hypothetical protein
VRHLLEVTRVLLSKMKVPKPYWGDIPTTCYLIIVCLLQFFVVKYLMLNYLLIHHYSIYHLKSLATFVYVHAIGSRVISWIPSLLSVFSLGILILIKDIKGIPQLFNVILLILLSHSLSLLHIFLPLFLKWIIIFCLPSSIDPTYLTSH